MLYAAPFPHTDAAPKAPHLGAMRQVTDTEIARVLADAERESDGPAGAWHQRIAATCRAALAGDAGARKRIETAINVADFMADEEA